ncbi:hypothetical protein [Acuticoccus kandeliae]|uniref:hypothetical protein n=1 Tax=Acuticoccus kandeliae TaxID=2073160 RepID=UPI000D3E061A|nr:hypothetical protein [Acuticoccus kandeliae]
MYKRILAIATLSLLPFAAMAQNTIDAGGEGGQSTREAMQESNVDRLPTAQNTATPKPMPGVKTPTLKSFATHSPRPTRGDGDGIEDGDEAGGTLKAMQESNVDRLPVR